MGSPGQRQPPGAMIDSGALSFQGEGLGFWKKLARQHFGHTAWIVGRSRPCSHGAGVTQIANDVGLWM